MGNRVVVITGANSGIGYHMAAELLKMGDRVACLDIETDQLSALSQKYPRLSFYDKCDVSEPNQVKNAINKVISKWNRIDILVNNACLAIFSSFEDKKLEDTRREFDVNYFGYLNMIEEVFPIMETQGKGVIHNVSSGVGLTGFPGIYGYASTKGAIEALTRTLSIEMAIYGIVVNVIHPPLVNTKSSSPLGIPKQAMADASDVGKKLAKKIGIVKPNITPDLSTSIGLFFNRHFPVAMGKFLNKLTQRAKIKKMNAASFN